MLAIASLLSGKSHGEAGPESHHDRGMLPVTLAFGFGRGKYYSAWRCCKAKTSCKGLTAVEGPTSVPRGTDWRFAFSILSRTGIGGSTTSRLTPPKAQFSAAISLLTARKRIGGRICPPLNRATRSPFLLCGPPLVTP